MTKRILAIALFLPIFVWAKTPNEDDIVETITDNTGDYYYPDMMIRFEMGDSTLTLDQYHYLYYGYAYQESYKPLNTIHEMDNLIVLASQIDPDKPEKEILQEVIASADKVVAQDPFNPKVWNILAYAYGCLGEKAKEREAYRRMESILSVINSSGEGLKEKDAKHIIMFDHALDYMASQNLTHTKAMIISRNVEFIPLLAPRKVDGKKFRGYYFDFSRVYWNKPDSVTYKRDRTWQFNNLKPREYK